MEGMVALSVMHGGDGCIECDDFIKSDFGSLIIFFIECDGFIKSDFGSLIIFLLSVVVL